jgi:hypothetical protein
MKTKRKKAKTIEKWEPEKKLKVAKCMEGP